MKDQLLKLCGKSVSIITCGGKGFAVFSTGILTQLKDVENYFYLKSSDSTNACFDVVKVVSIIPAVSSPTIKIQL